MEFSPEPGYTYGTRDVCGCMGIINSRHFSLDTIQEDESIGQSSKEIYVLVDVSDPLKKDEERIFRYGKGFVPTWTQTQFMYVLPPKEIVPDGKNFDDLRDITFEEWLTQTG